VNGSSSAELIGPDTSLRDRVAEALTATGWDVSTGRTRRTSIGLGVFIPTEVPPAPLEATSAAEWWSLVHRNLTPAFLFASELIPRLSTDGAAMVFVSSLLGEIGAPEQTAWSAAAAGIIGSVKALTLDVPGVRFSAVAPAWPPPQHGWHAADVEWPAPTTSWAIDLERATAEVVAFLANDRAGHHRGQVIRIPSGVTT
jgi:hypothetical protein